MNGDHVEATCKTFNEKGGTAGVDCLPWLSFRSPTFNTHQTSEQAQCCAWSRRQSQHQVAQAAAVPFQHALSAQAAARYLALADMGVTPASERHIDLT